MVAIGLVAETSDAVPMMEASELLGGSGRMYTPAARERSTTATAAEIAERARMEMRMTNQWRRQKEAERVCLRWGGTRSEVDERGCDRDIDSENEWVGLGLDDGRASEVAAWAWMYDGGDGERVTKWARLGTGETVGFTWAGAYCRGFDTDVICPKKKKEEKQESARQKNELEKERKEKKRERKEKKRRTWG